MRHTPRHLTRLLDTSTTSLGPNRVEAIAGTSTKARDGWIVEMRGMDTSAFLRSGTILWNHDPAEPVGTPASGRVDSAGNLRLVIDFAPAGLSARADEIRNLVKAGVVRNLSIGFDVIEAEPLDARNPRGGMRVTRSELLEVSFVTVPADALAVVTARSGKVLSAVNATSLRSAYDLAERCRSTLDDMLEAERRASGSGKVLGPVTEKFQAAHDFAKGCRSGIGQVLEGAGETDGARSGKVLSSSNVQSLQMANSLARRCSSTIREALAARELLSGVAGAPARSAQALAERCRSTLVDVLEAAGEDPDAVHDDMERRRRQIEVLARKHPPTAYDERVKAAKASVERAAASGNQGWLRRAHEVLALALRAYEF